MGISLLSATSHPIELTEQTTRQTVRRLIQETVEMGYDPYQMAAQSDLRNLFGPTMPQPETEEAMQSSQAVNALTDWIVQTEEMQQALTMLQRIDPKQAAQYGVTVEKLQEEPTLYNLITEITPVESDYQ
jgi:hypothetical protein